MNVAAKNEAVATVNSIVRIEARWDRATATLTQLLAPHTTTLVVKSGGKNNKQTKKQNERKISKIKKKGREFSEEVKKVSEGKTGNVLSFVFKGRREKKIRKFQTSARKLSFNYQENKKICARGKSNDKKQLIKIDFVL